MNTNNNNIFFFGELTNEKGADITQQLLSCNQKDPTAEITLYIDSYGGSVTQAWMIIDVMNYIRNNVKIIVVGNCASAALHILMSGERGKRLIMKHSVFIFHDGGVESYVKKSDINSLRMFQVKNFKKENEAVVKHTNITSLQLKKMIRKEIFFDAEQCIKYGFADRIIEKQE